MKKSYKIIFGMLLVLVVFTGLSMVSASDVNTSSASSSISTVNSNTQTSDLLTGADYSNYQQNVDNSSDYSNEYSSNLNDVAVTSDGNTTTSNTGSYSDLANLINNSNGTVNLNSYYIYNSNTDSKYVYGINITHDLTINGNGYNINANNQASIFNIYNSTVNLNELNLYNAYINESTLGGAIYAKNSDVTLNDCAILNNHIKLAGGAIAAFNSNLTMIDSYFVNNSAYAGGAILLVNSTGNSSFSTFRNNYGETGGAICLINTLLWVNNSWFINNTANTLNLMDYTNYYGGGAISAYNGQLALINSYFDSNIATGNESITYSGEGGAVALANSTCGVSNCSFDDNYANAAAGAIWSWDDELYIVNSEFYNNTAKRNGGAVLVQGDLFIKDSEFVSNIVNSTNPLTGFIYGGGAIYQYDGDCYVNNTYFSENVATGSLDESGFGGAIFSKGNFNISDSDLENNHAENRGGAIYTNDVNVVGTGFINNSALNEGGAIYSNNITVIDSDFVSNYAISSGAIHSLGDVITDHSVFINNSAINLGGAISAFNSVVANDSVFINNSAYFMGGAIAASNSDINITNSILLNNQAIKGSALTYYLGNINVNYNWWGNNTPFTGENYNKLIYHYIDPDNGSYVPTDNWVIMTLNVNATNVTLGDIISETVSFTHYTDGNNTYNMTNLIPEIPFTTSYNDGYTPNKTRWTNNNTYTIYYHAKTSGNFTGTFTTVNQTLTYNFTVNPLTNKSTVLNTPEYDFMYGNNTYTGTLLDSNGNGVAYRTVSLNLTRFSTGASKVYNVTTNIYGEYTLPVTLTPGFYRVNATFAGDNDYTGSNNKSGMFISGAYIVLDDINATYGDNISVNGYLKDYNNAGISNQTVNLQLVRAATGQWKIYNVTTDNNGMFTLPITLSPGNYYILATSDYILTEDNSSLLVINNGTVDNREVTVNGVNVNPKNVNGIVGVYNNHTSLPLANVNVTLEFTRLSNGLSKNYTVTTDNDGYYSLPITLGAGDYKIKSIYEGTSQYQPSTDTETLTIS